jgi:hypothetical protein
LCQGTRDDDRIANRAQNITVHPPESMFLGNPIDELWLILKAAGVKPTRRAT